MKIICDTHVLIFWASQPEKLSERAANLINTELKKQALACADISLWEIAMLVEKGRLNLPKTIQPADYIQTIIDAMQLSVIPISPHIAEMAQHQDFIHGDPADRLIAATTLAYNATLISADQKFQQVKALKWVW
ncbi:MAG: type II toxin-antitoxin system VapC family toxin [Thiomicrospira sp.]|jgi:PIN domain nuclease of toxin-antitoxin system|nr:type II toxin-antitoxin system VapC family toxin [Thiomicrospira sp.]